MRFIGDVHGLFPAYDTLIQDVEESIQLGDFGIGFGTKYYYIPNDTRIYSYWEMPESHLFIRGNHDSPLVCKEHPNCLNTFGIIKNDIFYLAGGLSIDKEFRKPGVNWWEDEELSIKECYAALDMYVHLKPRIVVSHEGPEFVVPLMNFSCIFSSRTSQLLEAMFNAHKPEYWIFGHYHKSWKQEVLGVKFQCLKELEKIDLNL